MSVRLRKWKDKDGKVQEAWAVDVKFQHPDGRVERIRKASPVNTRRGAEQYERELRQALLHGTFGKEKKEVPTLEQFQERFLDHARTNNKVSTAKTKADILRKHLVPAFGRLKLDQIDTAKIETFKAQKVKEGLSKKSVNNLLTVLRKLLALAQEFGELDVVPKVEWLKAPKPEIDFLSFEEAEQLESLAEPGRWKAMISLALNTGLRIGELAALSWDCVDMTAGRLIVKRNVFRGHLGTPKGGREREVPLNERALKALRDYPRRIDSPWVFPQRDGGFIRNPQHTCSEAILRNAERAGIRPIGWHTLRHTFASHLVMRGVPLKAVQELMGHATIDMTMRYAHLSPNVKKDAVRALDVVRPRGTLGAHDQEGIA
ncbi:site-specific integrase [Cystobacter fuscus]|uniref:tyrosine-type recombinase/integrase n=1 Tax=Cystobacter fuscus TaxID=43 RepID=UPI002B28E33B|nr:site-specific integrase [Cystobacter fuscus]